MVGASPRTKDPFGLVGQTLDQRFSVEEVVAEGGFGVVYRAQQLTLDRPVALKALKLDEAAGRPADFQQRFAEEARTMARLKHPHIADVYDTGISTIAAPGGGTRQIPWIALEWLEGHTLEEVLSRRRGARGLPPAEALAFMRSALEAVAHAHRQGVAHRDIKPGNIMLTRTAAGSTLRILDFGISKIMQPDEAPGTGRTRTSGAYAFSPGYAAPDQISGGRTGPWTDVHALGLVLTEVLTDEPPVSGEDIAVFSQLLSERRPTPGSKGRDLGPWEAVLARALALQPSDRWRDAGALLAALDATVLEADRASRDSRSGKVNPVPAGAATVPVPHTGDVPVPPVASPAADSSRRPAKQQRAVTFTQDWRNDGDQAAPARRSRLVSLALVLVLVLAAAGAAVLYLRRPDGGGGEAASGRQVPAPPSAETRPTEQTPPAPAPSPPAPPAAPAPIPAATEAPPAAVTATGEKDPRPARQAKPKRTPPRSPRSPLPRAPSDGDPTQVEIR